MGALCPNCGTTNRPLARFCMRCVTSLSTPEEDAAEGSAMGSGPSAPDQRTVLCTAPFAVTQVGDAEDVRPRSAFSDHALPDGTVIEGFRIVRPIGEGGFGVVYLAWDAALERHVAIKEYMPASLAMRGAGSLDVSMRSESNRATFDAGLKSFVNEARLLARFDHPSLVKVFRFWEGNRTAYMAMPYYEGPTLKTALARIGIPVPEAQLREWLHPLLDALAVMHKERCYHRDISPDNILITASGPLLLDFGAARRVISDLTQPLTAVLKPGFAPIEQYGGAMAQGPWTDLYALAGVVNYAITGWPPIASVVRVVEDTQKPLAQTHAGRYSSDFLQAIDAALSVRPDARPQDVAAFRALLDTEAAAEMPALAVSREGRGMDLPMQADVRTITDERPHSAMPAPLPVPVPLVAAAVVASMSPAAGAQAGSAVPERRGVQRWAAAAVALAVAGAGWWIAHKPPHDAASGAAPVATAPAVRAALPAAAAPVAVTPAPAPASAPAPAATATVSPVPDATARATRVPSVKPPSRIAERPIAVAETATAIEPRPPARKEQELAPTYTEAARSPRCGDIVLKSSLEPLNPEEIAFLKSRCR